MKIKYRTEKIIELQDWNKLVKSVYNKPYNLQQQNGCYGNGEYVSICFNDHDPEDEFLENESVPLKINGDIRGVRFDTWIKTDPNEYKIKDWRDWEIEMFWERNFYPDVNMIAYDLYLNGYLDLEEYTIKISW